jgi:phytoene dehydrogenase-like protein
VEALRANVIGSGPNGLAAAITLARAGVRVAVYEAMSRVGGAVGSAEVTLPGFTHDLGASVFPLGAASPFFRSLDLESRGLRWIQPEAAAAHPLDDGSALLLRASVDETAGQFSAGRGEYQRLFTWARGHWETIAAGALQPVLHIPKSTAEARFFALAALPATIAANRFFPDPRAQALFAGMAAHSVLPFHQPGSAGIGIFLAAAGHAVGWPIAAGGAQRLSDALAGILKELGGTIHLDAPVRSLAELEPAGITMCDMAPARFIELAGDKISRAESRRMSSFRHGPGIFKVDYALSEPIPFRAAACRSAATVHIGGDFAEIAAAEDAAWRGKITDRPFVLLVQPSLFDPSRAPAGAHTAWAYCHVPNGSDFDMLPAIESQIERFAPGFRDCVKARKVSTPQDMEAWNPNLIGGDISGGAMTIRQMLFRPGLIPYKTGMRGVYLCSASTPPGGGVHGMCGYLAAQRALRDLRD